MADDKNHDEEVNTKQEKTTPSPNSPHTRYGQNDETNKSGVSHTARITKKMPCKSSLKRGSNPFPQPKLSPFFFSLPHTNLLASFFWVTSCGWSQVSSLQPPGSCLQIIIAHMVQQSHCSSIFHRVLPGTLCICCTPHMLCYVMQTPF